MAIPRFLMVLSLVMLLSFSAVAADHAIFAAIAAKDAKRVLALIQQDKQSLEARTGDDGNTPLHQAALSKQFEIVSLLVEQGAPVMVTNNDGETPLHAAARQRDMKITEYLLAHGANINACDRLQRTPLFEAVSIDCAGPLWGHDAEKYIKALVAAGADINLADKYGATPLHVALGYDTSILATVSNLTMSAFYDFLPGIIKIFVPDVTTNVARFLVDRGADITAITGDGVTSLEVATMRGNRAIVKLLLAKGVDPKHVDASGMTIMHAAAYSTDSELIKMFVKAGFDVNAVTTSGMTPLHMAANALGKRSPAAVASLLKRGAKIDALDKDGRSVLYYTAAKQYDNTEIKIMELLLKHGGKSLVNIQDNKGRTPLFAAIEIKAAKSVAVLLKAGARLDITDKDGVTPKQLAEKQGDTKVLALLSKNTAPRK